MVSIEEGIEVARDIAKWLHENVKTNAKPNLAPTYGSYFNQTVRWNAVDNSWVVVSFPKRILIDVYCDDSTIEILIKLRYS